MTLLDLTLPTPAENLACDEAMLDIREENGGDGILRFWESQNYFVVVGYANKAVAEADLAACAANKIPILRRCTGGGTVLQGPGCLNYSLILNIEEAGRLRSIPSTNRSVLERNRAAIETLLSSKLETRNAKPSIEGQTDLAIDGLKFSGNAQRRGKRFLLFHGTFLLDFDIPLIGKVLPLPSKQPGYRRHRTHADFLMNLKVPAADVKRALQMTWDAASPLKDFPAETTGRLAREKYAAPEWNFKF